MEFQIQEPISQLRLRSDAGHRRAVHAPVAPAPGRGELLPPQRAGELRQLAGVRLAGTGRPGRRPWRPAPRFYLYNWRDAASHPGIRHGSQHPEVALRNARARFSLTWREEDIIRSHMFPYTPTKVYRCLESAVVSTMDKLCAAAELVGLVPLLTRFRRETPFWLDADWAPTPLRKAG